MKFLSALALATLIFSIPTTGIADEARLAFGGDQYVAGQTASMTEAGTHDVFAAGYDVSLKAPVTGDAHLAGFNVTSDTTVSGDLYAGGSAINLQGSIGGDATAFGSSITLRSAAPVAGNVRFAGATVTLSAPIGGSALITAQTLNLETSIVGDLNFFGESITFGPGAKVTGKVTIQAPKEIVVPDSVASADRVSFTQLVAPDYATEAGKTAEHVVRSVWPAVWATGLWWLLLAVVGLVFITLGARLVAALEGAAASRPFRRLGLGLLVFASVLGLVPVLALTIIGIVLLPFVFMFVFVACALAYLAGTYLVGARIGGALLKLDTNLKRFGVLVVSIIVAGLLGMVPVIGWLVTLLLLVFGFGAFGVVTMARWSAADAPRVAAPLPA